jgi:hypothetical protein
MNVDFSLGIIGLCGGLLCAAADMLLDLKGKGIRDGLMGHSSVLGRDRQFD